MLVQTVRALGDAADGAHAKLGVFDVEDDKGYQITEFDGKEHVRTSDGTPWIFPRWDHATTETL